MLVEACDRALGDGLGVVDRDTVHALAVRARRGAGLAQDDDRQLGGAEAVHDVAVEAAGELGDVAVAGLVAEGDAQGVVGVVLVLGGGQHVGQRLADVVHVGDAVATHVVEESRGRELRRHHRRPAADGDRPPGDDGVGVEQRHREVADVVGGHREPVDQVEPGEEHHQVRHLHGLGVAGGAGGEDHHEGVHRLHLAQRRQLARGGDLLRPGVGADVHDPHVTEVDVLEQRQVLGVGEQQLALRAAYVGREALAAAGRVDAAQDVAAETRAGHRPQHRGGVAQERADVRRALGVERGDHGSRLRRGLGQVFAPGPGPVGGRDGGPVVLESVPEHLLHVLGHTSPCVRTRSI